MSCDFFFRGTLQMTRDLCIFLLFSLCRWHGSLRFLGMSDNSHVICRYYNWYQDSIQSAILQGFSTSCHHFPPPRALASVPPVVGCLAWPRTAPSHSVSISSTQVMWERNPNWGWILGGFTMVNTMVFHGLCEHTVVYLMIKPFWGFMGCSEGSNTGRSSRIIVLFSIPIYPQIAK